jgi:hypothetical protein
MKKNYWMVLSFFISSVLISLSFADEKVMPPPSVPSATEIQRIYSSRLTTVKREGCKITVTINIQFIGPKATQALADAWKQNIENTWNGAGQKYGCCNVVFNVVTAVGGDPQAGFHQITVQANADRSKANAGIDNKGLSVDGTWYDPPLNPGSVAHETGHLLGLDDEYHNEDKNGDGNKEWVNDNPQRDEKGNLKDPQSIMAQTWDDNPNDGIPGYAPLQSHINQIVELGGVNCPHKITLEPKEATNNLTSTHTVMATVVDRNGKPMQGEYVHFEVTGANSPSGDVITDANGKAAFSYTGINLGDDTITATVCTGQPEESCSAKATKHWVY